MAESGVVRRAVGAVVGSAVGDALGAPFEFGPPNEYSRRHPVPVIGGVGEMTGGGHFGWAPAEFTDDTQMAIVQAESLLATTNGNGRRHVDGRDLFECFRLWARGAADVGTQTRAVLHSGLPWNRAAAEHYRKHPRNGAGNGSLMRATPTAVRFVDDDVEHSIAVAHATSAVTHGDPAAGWGTAIYHAMIHAAVNDRDPFAALADMLAALPDDQHRFRDMLAPGWSPNLSTLTNGSVWGCLAQAVWAVRHHDTFAGAVTAAIDLGDDTDTVAAVAGGLAGAIHGIGAIPSRWTTYVHGHVTDALGSRTYKLADLIALTRRLLDEYEPPEAAVGPPRGPIEIAPQLFAADLAAATDVDPTWGVVSLCRAGDRFDRHPFRRSVHLIDSEQPDPMLAAVVTDALDTIDAFLAEDRPTVVHCHHGASRTGLVLRAWLMRRHGWDEPTATVHLARRWPHLSLWNDTFTAFLQNDFPAVTTTT
jgi:ADP-ribosyl-[dinitrogen reductase] hydrolase